MSGKENSKFLTSQIFSNLIESRVSEFDGSYMDCIIELCIEKKIDIESVKHLLTQPIKEKLADEAREKNLMKKVIKIDA